MKNYFNRIERQSFKNFLRQEVTDYLGRDWYQRKEVYEPQAVIELHQDLGIMERRIGELKHQLNLDKYLSLDEFAQ
ncbi:MAG: hypothetical protein KJ799_08590 [Bacteroidetes bacterium]|nr:hypothetical protein [Bacteroidota bacterium]MBU1680527.1 hypothetical protein [Bacteroidota bacterium]MBU2506767.1 hypothetical protein [Bacteroidota bacterium]